MRRIARFCLLLALGTALPMDAVAEGAVVEPVPPYKMVRTLQDIQDTVINGDLNAVEMQRFLLGEIDKRLKTADMSIFDDTRNVDAALIYAMSGGNPETLNYLAERDIAGNFDNRVTSVLRRYLNGKGGSALMQLKEIVPEYRNTEIGPYLELIGANALMEKDEVTALKFFDWARVESPGSIVEEAALRRSLSLTSRKGDTAKALPYARRYARRFMSSPYASQFADIFVGLALDHQKALPPSEIKEVLSLVERKRQREIYLRLARRAAINGNRDLADFASDEARQLSTKGDNSQLALAELYSGIVDIPTDDIEDVLTRLSSIKNEDLSPKDRFLRDAAQIVAEEVVGPPSQESLTQVQRDMVNKEYRDRMS
jgi:chemotaxis protein MotC